MSEQKAHNNNVSASASARSARLVAVQGIYEILHRKASARNVIQYYQDKSKELELHGEPQVPPNIVLMSKIILGVNERMDDLQGMLDTNLPEKASGESKKEIEILLRAILLAGIYEIMNHLEIDAPIIINDYLDVTHGFYGEGQVKMVNAILDKLKSVLR